MSKKFLVGLALVSWVFSVAANYYVDNANNTVAYSSSGTTWKTYSYSIQNLTLVTSNGNYTVDSSKCYDQNYALAACTIENNCQITFPFTGSGITVYVMLAGFQGISVSLTVDGGQPISTTMPAPAPPTYQTPNVSLFDLQSLPSSDHIATISLLDWENGSTSLYFDYALVNETFVALPGPAAAPTMTSLTPLVIFSSTLSLPTSATHSSTPIPSATPSSTLSLDIVSTIKSGPTSAVPSTTSSVSLGVKVGSACGGVAIIIVIVVIIFLWRKSRRTRLEASHKPDPFPAPSALSSHWMTPSPTPPAMDEQTQRKITARTALPYYSYRQFEDKSSDFHILSASDITRRYPTVGTRSHLSSVIDIRREGGLSSDTRGSVNGRGTPHTGVLTGSSHLPTLAH